MRKLLFSASIAALLVSGPAFAKNDKKPAPAPTPTPAPAPAPAPKKDAPVVCALADLVPGALACGGFYAGNLLGGSTDKLSDQAAGLKAIGFDWNGDWSAITKIDSLNGSKTLDFGKMLYGTTYLGLHFGGGGPTGVGNGTAFYKIDVSDGLQQVALKYQGSSGAVLYSTGPKPVVPPPGGGGTGGVVPEPATWAMMLGGFGLLGGMIRRKRRTQAIVFA